MLRGMTIDNDAAALFAQVIPALLVFLALEDRLSPSKIANQDWRQRLTKWREGAVVLNLVALGLCLVIVVTDVEESTLVVGLNAFIAISTLALLTVLALLFAGMFVNEDAEAQQP
jgi:hypothetical protein